MIDKKVIKAGITSFKKGEGWKYYCNCGHVGDSRTCPECGNSYFASSWGDDKPVQMGAFLIDELKTSRIKVTRYNFSAQVIDEKFTIKKFSMHQTVDFDFFKQDIQIFKNDKLVLWVEDGELMSNESSNKSYITLRWRKDEIIKTSSFFQRGMEKSEYGFKRLFLYNALVKASNLNDFDYDTVNHAKFFFEGLLDCVKNTRGIGSRGLTLFYLFDFGKKDGNQKTFAFFEKLINAGLKVKLNSFSNKVVGTNEYLLDEAIGEGKKLHQIIGVPKSLLNIMRENEIVIERDIFDLGFEIRRGNVNIDSVRKIIDKASEFNLVSDVWKIISPLAVFAGKYNYNPERLCEYLFSDIMMHQGITRFREGFNLLKDYVSMSEELGYNFDKYPDSLKRAHDVKMVNYNAIKSTLDDKKFITRVEEYKELEFENNDFIIKTPDSVQDLVEEGSKLSHCIASYKNNIINGRSLIFFLRKKDNPEEPYVSIELDKYHRLVQERAEFNVEPDGEALKFIHGEWRKFINAVDSSTPQIKRTHVIENFQ